MGGSSLQDTCQQLGRHLWRRGWQLSYEEFVTDCEADVASAGNIVPSLSSALLCTRTFVGGKSHLSVLPTLKISQSINQ